MPSSPASFRLTATWRSRRAAERYWMATKSEELEEAHERAIARSLQGNGRQSSAKANTDESLAREEGTHGSGAGRVAHTLWPDRLRHRLQPVADVNVKTR